MESLFTITWTSLTVMTISALGIYFSVILFTRISGKRSFSKMSSFDFAMTVAVGSIIATTILSSTVNLVEGIFGLFIVYLLQMSIALARRNRFIEKLVDNKPLLLMDGEKILDLNLRKARVSESDLRSKLREANVTKLSQIKAVIFETTGDISVLHSDSDHSVDLWLMKDVNRA